MSFRSNKESRTRQILDYLDQLKSDRSAILDSSTSSLNSSNTQRWLHDIGLRKFPPSPSRSIRTSSRLNTIIAASKLKSSFNQRPSSHLELSPRKLNRSIEVESEPEDEISSKIVQVKATPYTVATKKHHDPILKGPTGRNVAPNIKKNVFSAKVPEFSIDHEELVSVEALEAVKPPSLPTNFDFVTKPRNFSFSKPVLRGPETFEEYIETETYVPSTDSGASEGESADDEVEEQVNEFPMRTTKVTTTVNSETSSSNSSLNMSTKDATNSQPKFKKWDCPECMLQIVDGAEKCPCCGTSNPALPKPIEKEESGLKSFAGKDDTNSQPKSKKWDCPECMLQIVDGAEKCPCCGTSNPALSKPIEKEESGLKSFAGKTAPSSFQFGFVNVVPAKPADALSTTSASPFNVVPAKPADISSTNPAQSFNFVPAKPADVSSTNPAPSFNFVPAKPADVSSTNLVPSFNFVPAKPADALSTTSASLFNVVPAKPAEVSSTNSTLFNFGSAKSADVFSTNSGPSFNFGATKPAGALSMTSAPSFNFGSAKPADVSSTNSAPSFNFGLTKPADVLSANPAPSFNFGATKPADALSMSSSSSFNFGPAKPSDASSTNSTVFNFNSQPTTTTSTPTFGFGNSQFAGSVSTETNGFMANPFLSNGSGSSSARKLLSARRRMRQ